MLFRSRVFYLDETSEIFRRREEFEIVAVYPDPEADLQVYYDFDTAQGMSRGEAREKYLELTRALRSHFPVFQSTNMLYHELKSHYFLYLVKHGSWEALRDRVLIPGTSRTEDAPPRPRRRPALLRRALCFDRGRIDERVARVFSSALRPRYQMDLLDDADREHLDRELPREEPSASQLVYDPATGVVQCVSPSTAMLLERCDGSRTHEEVVEVVPAAHQGAARRCLADLAAAGLLETFLPR